MNSAGSRKILFEGLTESEILSLPKEQLAALVLNSGPAVFKIGSATVLGEFRLANESLVIELAQIEDGGEGVLIALASLAKRFAQQNEIPTIEWIVHAINCAKPNLKLRRVLIKRGFAIRGIAGIGEAYYRKEHVD